jgi:hypothetical protein
LPNCHRSNGAYVNVRACEYTFKAGNAQDKVWPVCATRTSWARDVTEAGKNSDAFGVVFMLHHSTLAACVNVGCFFFCHLLPFLIGCFFSCHLLPFLIDCFFSWTGAVAAPDGRPGSSSRRAPCFRRRPGSSFHRAPCFRRRPGSSFRRAPCYLLLSDAFAGGLKPSQSCLK